MREREREHIHTTFMTVYCYKCSHLLLIIVNLLLHLIYKLSFIVGVYVEGKHSVYEVATTQCFRHPLGGLGLYSVGKQELL